MLPWLEQAFLLRRIGSTNLLPPSLLKPDALPRTLRDLSASPSPDVGVRAAKLVALLSTCSERLVREGVPVPRTQMGASDGGGGGGVAAGGTGSRSAVLGGGTGSRSDGGGVQGRGRPLRELAREVAATAATSAAGVGTSYGSHDQSHGEIAWVNPLASTKQCTGVPRQGHASAIAARVSAATPNEHRVSFANTPNRQPPLRSDGRSASFGTVRERQGRTRHETSGRRDGRDRGSSDPATPAVPSTPAIGRSSMTPAVSWAPSPEPSP
jgi:hypothetical protein